ncbi:MAG: PIN domain-containing protein [Methylococcales bacterium]
MISVDTNVLLRILSDDPEALEQMRAARALAKKAGSLFVTQIVQVETVWVLQKAYGFDKSALLTILIEIQNHPAVRLEQPERFAKALCDFQSGNVEFSDCLILAASRESRTKLA